MAQLLRTLAVLPENLSLDSQNPHGGHNFSSKGSNALFQFPQLPGMHVVQIYMYANHSYT